MSQKCSRRAEIAGETGPVPHKGDMSGTEAFHWLSSQRLLGVGWDLTVMGFPQMVPSFVPNSGTEIEQHIMLPDWHQGGFINQQVSVLAWSFSHCLPSRADTCHLLKSVHSLSAVAEFCLFFISSLILPRWYYLSGCPCIIKSLSLGIRFFFFCC